jgi:hypothetical protein
MKARIPPFDERGYLPPGVYETDETEFNQRFGFNSYRQQLLAGLHSALIALKQAGCDRVYIGGSFVTNKEEPGDIDGCFEGISIDENLLDSIFLNSDLEAQKARFGTELVFGSNRAGFFQTDRSGNPQGIVAIDL